MNKGIIVRLLCIDRRALTPALPEGAAALADFRTEIARLKAAA